MMTVSNDALETYKRALQKELEFQRNQEEHKYWVSNGKFLSIYHGEYVYSFDFDIEELIPDGIPVCLCIENDRYYGTVIASEESQLLLMLQKEVQNTKNRGYVTITPWKLLEALLEKLQKFSYSDEIALNLLKNNSGELGNNKRIVSGQECAKLFAMQKPITVIWGPPGTGKTHTISEITATYLRQGKTVLLVSQSNVSVDGMTLKIAEILKQRNQSQILTAGKVFRYGFSRTEELKNNIYLNSCNFALNQTPNLKKILDELQKKKKTLLATKQTHSVEYVGVNEQIRKIYETLKETEKRFVLQAQALLCTISKVQIDPIFEDRKFDVVIFDEVSMAYVPQIIFAAMKAKEHFVAVGDFKQLAPIAESPEGKEILTRDIFSFLKINDKGNPMPHNWLVMLEVQRRMHPVISEFSNLNFYSKLLKDFPRLEEDRKDIVQRFPMKGRVFNLINIGKFYAVAAKTSFHSRFNILSAVISFITGLTCEEKGEKDIGIITPYAAQARLIKAMIRDHKENCKSEIICSTVHQFQGSEKNVIIFDVVENYPLKKLGWLTSKNENESLDRLVNVAVTRAKGKFFTIANKEYWEQKSEVSNSICKLITHIARIDCEMNNMVTYLSAMSAGRDIVIYRDDFDLPFEKLMKSMASAKVSIQVTLPDSVFNMSQGNRILQEISNAEKNGISVQVFAFQYEDLPPQWQKISQKIDREVPPLICIDDNVIWYGLPLPSGEFKEKIDKNRTARFQTSCPIVVEFKGKRTIRTIKELLDLEKNSTAKEEKNIADTDLASFISQNEKCRHCQGKMNLRQNWKKRAYLQCSACKKTSYLEVDTVNAYIERQNIVCPEHQCLIQARLGKNGIYIRCAHGHFVDLTQL